MNVRSHSARGVVGGPIAATRDGCRHPRVLPRSPGALPPRIPGPAAARLGPPPRAVAEGAGRFRAEGAPSSMVGRWDMGIAIREDGRRETARFALSVDSSS